MDLGSFALQSVTGVRVKHHPEKISCGFLGLGRVQKWLGTSSKEKVCLKINFMVVLQLSCLSNRGKGERETKPLSYCQEWVFLTFNNENHFERIKEFFCFHSTKNQVPLNSLWGLGDFLKRVSIKLFFDSLIHSLFEGAYGRNLLFYLDLMAWNKFCCFPLLEN